MEVKLQKLGKLIADCWAKAETNLTQLIAEKYPNPREEFITDLLAGELRDVVGVASQERRVEAAFLDDLKGVLGDLYVSDARRFRGLIAEVNPHTHSHEGNVSAADLGILVVRPVVDRGRWRERIGCSRDHATGLLAQAKLGKPRALRGGYKWDSLTDQQEDLFPDHCQYYSLLLYRLKGETANQLDPLRWQLCHNRVLNEVKGWLRSDSFPEELSSPVLLGRLFDSAIGTNDRNIIDSVIAPKKGDPRIIEIRIFWPDGSGPPSSLRLHNTHHQNEVLHIRH